MATLEIDSPKYKRINPESDESDIECNENCSNQIQPPITEINWKKDVYNPIIHLLSHKMPYELVDVKRHSTESDFFKLFMDKSLVKLVANETNRFYKNAAKSAQASCLFKTKPDEIYLFLAICMLFSRNPYKDLSAYWAEDSGVYSTLYERFMSKDRFCKMLNALHFEDDDLDPSRSAKINTVIGHLNVNLDRYMKPNQNLHLGESFVSQKPQTRRQPPLPNEQRFRIKVYAVQDVNTGYVFSVTTSVDIPRVDNVSNSNTMIFLSPFLDRGHTMYLCKSFSDPYLFATMHSRNTNVCGVIKDNHPGMPKFDETNRYYYTDIMMAQNWVYQQMSGILLSTFHISVSIEDAPNRLAFAVQDYVKNTRAYSQPELMISNIIQEQKAIKWYHKVFLHLVDICLRNAYVLYLRTIDVDMSFHIFQLRVLMQIFYEYKISEGRRKNTQQQEPEGQHYMAAWPKLKGRPYKKDCHVCRISLDKENPTRFFCRLCNYVPLCDKTCFYIYHNESRYKNNVYARSKI